MIDNLSILLSHALLLYMFYHVIYRDDVDEEAPPPKINLDADTSRYRPVRTTQKVKSVKVETDDAPPLSPDRRTATPPKKSIRGRRDA
jgi:hypothetical protein